MNNPGSFARSTPDRCPHCGREFHGLAITERLEAMRKAHLRRLQVEQIERMLGVAGVGETHYAESEMDPDYRYADDDSPVICPGSRFIGPRPPTRIEQRNAKRLAALEAARPSSPEFAAGGVIPQPYWTLPDDPFDPSSWNDLGETMRAAFGRISGAFNEMRPTLERVAEALDPEVDTRPPRPDGRPHPPRPSRTRERRRR